MAARTKREGHPSILYRFAVLLNLWGRLLTASTAATSGSAMVCASDDTPEIFLPESDVAQDVDVLLRAIGSWCSEHQTGLGEARRPTFESNGKGH